MADFSSLAQPVGALMRPSSALTLSDSLARAARILRETSAGFVPVADQGFLIGGVTERSLAECMERGLGPLEPVSEALVTGLETIALHASGAEALRRLRDLKVAELPVVDRDGRLVGVVGASDLYPRSDETYDLPITGGMATPFGVYLTAGGVKGGVGPLALVATGAMLFTVFLATSFGGEWIVAQIADLAGMEEAPVWVYSLLPFLLFMAVIRLLPLSGTHAAEHMTVHALEWGEPLEVEVVRRLPRVHPRCGTNLAVGLSLFLALAGWEWTTFEHLRLLAAAVVTMFAWRPLGHFVQKWITTKRPTDAQIRSGIRAARELIHNYQAHGRSHVPFGRRLLSSGIFHVMAGSLLAFGIVEGIAQLLGKSLGI